MPSHEDHQSDTTACHKTHCESLPAADNTLKADGGDRDRNSRLEKPDGPHSHHHRHRHSCGPEEGHGRGPEEGHGHGHDLHRRLASAHRTSWAQLLNNLPWQSLASAATPTAESISRAAAKQSSHRRAGSCIPCSGRTVGRRTWGNTNRPGAAPGPPCLDLAVLSPLTGGGTCVATGVKTHLLDGSGVGTNE